MRGVIDLALLVGVVFAAWVRTPISSLTQGAWARWQGEAPPSLFATFQGLPSRQDAMLEVPHEWASAGSLLDPALRTAISAQLGPEVVPIVAEMDEPTDVSLEIWAVGPTLRQRAIDRARAAGMADPETYAGHRAYLPQDARHQADRAVLDTLALATALDLLWPVDPGARVTSGFGPRRHPTLGTTRMHHGVDIAIPIGTPVFAAGKAKVVRSGEDAINGKIIKLDHGHGVTSAYCHGSALEVSIGDSVTAGQPIMKSGNSGRSTGPHLHFGVRLRGRAIDPAPFRPKVGA